MRGIQQKTKIKYAKIKRNMLTYRKVCDMIIAVRTKENKNKERQTKPRNRTGSEREREYVETEMLFSGGYRRLERPPYPRLGR